MAKRKKFKVVVCGYKPYVVKRDEIGFWIIDGKEVEEEYIITAENEINAEKIAIKKFEKDGGYFDEIVSVIAL